MVDERISIIPKVCQTERSSKMAPSLRGPWFKSCLSLQMAVLHTERWTLHAKSRDAWKSYEKK